MQNDVENINAQGGTPPSISFEKAWAGIQPSLDKEADRRKKKRRRFVFFLLSVIAICLVSSLVYRNFSNGRNDIVGKNNLQKVFNTPTTSIINIVPVIVSLGLVKDKKVNNATATIKNGKDKLRNSPIAKTQKGIIAKTANEITKHTEKKATLLPETGDVANNKKVAIDKLGNNSNTPKPAVNTNEVDSTVTTLTAKNSGDTLKPVDTANAKQTLANNDTLAPKKLLKGLHFGLQLNMPLHTGINSLDVNAKRQPLTMVIPQVFASKQLSKKSSLLIAATPYSQYYLNKGVVLSSGTYNVTIQQGSTQNSKPKQYTYRETVGINKLIATQATLLYQYQLTDKIKIGVGIANNWLQSTIIEKKVTVNNATVTSDSLYGIDKTGKEWKQLKPTFLLGKLDVGYQYKKLEFGVTVSTPLENITTKALKYKTPFNTNVFARWYLK